MLPVPRHVDRGSFHTVQIVALLSRRIPVTTFYTVSYAAPKT